MVEEIRHVLAATNYQGEQLHGQLKQKARGHREAGARSSLNKGKLSKAETKEKKENADGEKNQNRRERERM